MRKWLIPGLVMSALATLAWIRASAETGEPGRARSLAQAASDTQTFADVPPGHPYSNEIEWLYLNGFTAGCAVDPLRYCPDVAMNRAESAVFVEHGMHGADLLPPQPTSQTFADLPLDSWAAKWAEALWQDGYTAGCGTNPLIYCPWQGHTRAEGCVFFLHMLNGPAYEPSQPSQQTFADVPLDTWYAKWVKAGYEAGLITPCQSSPELRFCPGDPLSRGLAAYLMYQAKSGPAPTPTVVPPTVSPVPSTPTPTATSVPVGTVYYASPGDDLSRAVGRLEPGETLILHDGTYRASMVVGVQGTATGPITIRAEHDGLAVVDGEMQRVPLDILSTARHIVIEGIRFQNSSGGTVVIYGRNITLRRVSAYVSGEGNVHVYTIGYTRDVLLEDCAASGKGRNLYLIYESENIVLRRCWGWWMARNGTGDANNFSQFYGSDNSLIENCVGTVDPNPSVSNVNPVSYWIASWNATDSCNGNVIEGSVFYGYSYHNIWMGQDSAKIQQDNMLRNTVIIGDGGYTAVFQRGGHNFLVEGDTLVNRGMSWATLRTDDQAGVGSSAVVKNCSFVGGNQTLQVGSGTNVQHSYNNFHDVGNAYSGTSPGPGETFVNPGYDTPRYGDGAYLIRPSTLEGQGEGGTSIGAEILYQTVNGIPNGERLWPWPMEARICAETAHLFGGGRNGLSVTYETHQIRFDLDGDGQLETYDCAGGVWRTLEGVY